MNDVFKIKIRAIKKFPAHLTLPKEFIKANRIKVGDVVGIYIEKDTNQLIIKKEER